MELPPAVPYPMNMVDSFVVVAHEKSTNAARAKAWADMLQQADPQKKVSRVWLSGTNMDRCRETVVSQLGSIYDQGYKNPLLISGGGDGALHHNGNALLHSDTPDNIARTLLTPWPLGLKNDGFADLHNPQMAGSPLPMFSHPNGHVTYDEPMDIVLNDAHQTHMLLYTTFGPTADAAYMYSSDKHRQRRARWPRLLHTAVDLAYGTPVMLRRRPPAYAAVEGCPDRRIIELDCVHTAQMAGQLDFSSSTRLGYPGMHVNEVGRGGRLALVQYAGRLLLKRPQGVHSNEPVERTLTKGMLHCQVDGEMIMQGAEPLEVHALRVQPSGRVLRYYATKTNLRWPDKH